MIIYRRKWEWETCTLPEPMLTQLCGITRSQWVKSGERHKPIVSSNVTGINIDQGCVYLLLTKFRDHFDGLMQERLNSIANNLELPLSCNNPSILCMHPGVHTQPRRHKMIPGIVAPWVWFSAICQHWTLNISINCSCSTSKEDQWDWLTAPLSPVSI